MTSDTSTHLLEQPGITYVDVFQKNEKTVINDACRFWMEAGALQNREQGIARASMLCVVAYDGDKLVAVSTTAPGPLKQVLSNVCFFRCMVRPEYRRRHIATELATRAYAITENHCKENPELKVLGFAIQVETQDLVLKCYKPVWNDKLMFIGYNENGLPIYMRWYDHANFGEPNKDPDFTFYPQRPGTIGNI